MTESMLTSLSQQIYYAILLQDQDAVTTCGHRKRRLGGGRGRLLSTVNSQLIGD
jgi:hypothetical protein